jgi:uncharacterized membrane protein
MDDFRRFFVRGLATLLPTLITIFLLAWIWNQLSDKLGRHIVTGLRYGVKWVWVNVGDQPSGYVSRYWDGVWDRLSPWETEVLGVVLAIILVYIVGLFVGNLIGRTLWRLGEVALMRIPVVRAIYPSVKQVTDFLLADHSDHFRASRVVAVQHRAQDVWTIGLVTGGGVAALGERSGEATVTVFVPSSPTAFSGYVVVVPRSGVVELPLSVEEAMRLLISGGVIEPAGSARAIGGSGAGGTATASTSADVAGRAANASGEVGAGGAGRSGGVGNRGGEMGKGQSSAERSG